MQPEQEFLTLLPHVTDRRGGKPNGSETQDLVLSVHGRASCFWPKAEVLARPTGRGSGSCAFNILSLKRTEGQRNSCCSSVPALNCQWKTGRSEG